MSNEPDETKDTAIDDTLVASDAHANTLDVSDPHASAPLVGRSSTNAEDDPSRGDTIGRFVILGVLGMGGMGLVYSAYDPHLDRKVAIKLLRTAAKQADEETARTRLLREAQAMAKIDHPNVVRVHEVGTFDDQVFLAMEFADAGTLRAWLTTKREQGEILDAFAKAGRGLAAAHAAGLVHRDFKPDNVLLSKDGSVRVTDFGLVSALADAASPPNEAREVAARTSHMSLSGSTPLSQQLTRTGAVMGTPTYMAPEQFENGPTSPATDQFAFCVALYEALYRQRPFAGGTFAALMTHVTEGMIQPISPSSPSVPAWLRRVLLRGMAVAPKNRFASMTDLLDALARVTVRRRRRIAAWAGGSIVVAGGVAAALALRGGPAECATGEDRTAPVWGAARVPALTKAFDASGRPHAKTTLPKARALLDTWTKSWQAGYLAACEATTVRGEQSAHLLDLRMQCLTRRLDDARATIDLVIAGGGDAIDHSLDAFAALPSVAPCADPDVLLATVTPPEAKVAPAVAKIRTRLDAARAEDRLGHPAKALALAQTALSDARATGYAPVIAEATLFTGVAQHDAADPATLTTLRDAMRLATSAGDDAMFVEAATWVISVMAVRAVELPVARELAELAEATATRAHPAPETITRLDNAISTMLVAQGKGDEAKRRYEHTLAVDEKRGGADDLAVLTTLNELGILAKTQGRFADARTYLERVSEAYGRVYGKEHPKFALSINNLALVEMAESKFDKAKELLDRSLELRIAALGPDHPEVAVSLSNLGNVYGELENRVEAQRYHQRALAIYEKVYGPGSLDSAGVLSNLGGDYLALGKVAEAKASYALAQKAFETAYGPDHAEVAGVLSNLAIIAQRENKLDDALALYQRALAISTKTYGPDHPDVADSLANISSLYGSMGKADESEAMLVKAIAALGKAYGEDHPRTAMGLANLGSLHYRRDNYPAAVAAFKRAAAIFEKKLGKDHPYVAHALMGEGDALAEMKRLPEAFALLERAVEIREAAKMPPGALAQIHLNFAQVLIKSPKQRARAIAQAKQALAYFVADKDDDGVKEVRAWIKNPK